MRFRFIAEFLYKNGTQLKVFYLWPLYDTHIHIFFHMEACLWACAHACTHVLTHTDTHTHTFIHIHKMIEQNQAHINKNVINLLLCSPYHTEQKHIIIWEWRVHSYLWLYFYLLGLKKYDQNNHRFYLQEENLFTSKGSTSIHQSFLLRYSEHRECERSI